MTGASGRQRADKRFIQRLKLNLPDLPTQECITYDFAKTPVYMVAEEPAEYGKKEDIERAKDR